MHDPHRDPVTALLLSQREARLLQTRQLFRDLITDWPANRTINFVFHGHSVPAGYHYTPEVRPFESYPFLVFQGLKKRFPNAVINCITTAIGGEDSVSGAQRFGGDVLSLCPALIFIDYALNDRRCDLALVENAWREMIVSTQQQAIPLVLVTPTGAEDAQRQHAEDPLSMRADLIRRLAQQYEVPVADVWACWKRTLDEGTDQSTLLSFHNHPNREGHQLAAQEILRVLGAMQQL